MGRYPCFGLCARERTRPTFCNLGVQCTTLVSTGVEPVILASARPTDHRRTELMITLLGDLCSTRFRLHISGGYAHLPSLKESFLYNHFQAYGAAGSRTLPSGKSLDIGRGLSRSQFRLFVSAVPVNFSVEKFNCPPSEQRSKQVTTYTFMLL